MASKKEEEYKILEFNYSKGKTENDNKEVYNFENHNVEKKYLISKKDYENGLKYSRKFVGNIHYYYNYYDFIENKYTKDFVLVNRNFLESLNIFNEEIFQKYYVGYFKFGNKQFIYFADDVVLEIAEKGQEEEEKENETKNSSKKNQKYNKKKEENSLIDSKDILRILILLYANEKHIKKLLQTHIEDEYNFEDYYLIDKDFIKEFKKDNKYDDLKEACEAFEYNYKGFYANLDQIINSSQIIKHKIKQKKYKAEDLYPNESEKLKKIEDMVCLDKFIIVPKSLFVLFFKNAEKSGDYPIEDFKHKILIGDDILFVKENDSSPIFGAYKMIKDQFKLFYLFQYNYDSLFYDEVKRYIRGKGIINYIIERKLISNVDFENMLNLKNENNKNIGKYINAREITEDKINKYKIKEKVIKYKNIVNEMNEFISNIWKLSDNKINIIDNNAIFKKINENNLNCLAVQVILDEDLNTLKQKLFFNDINDLSTFVGKKVINKQEENLNNDIFNSDDNDLIDFTKKMKIYKPKDIEKNKNNIYNIINIEILNMISESKKAEVEECFYFINKSNYYIFFFNKKRLYEIINYNHESDNFQLREYIPDKEENIINENDNKSINYKAFLKNIKDLINEEKKIKEKINSNFTEALKLEKYYLINTKWIHEFKKQFGYDYISNNPNKPEDKLLSKMQKAEITQLLSDTNNLNPNDLKKEVDFEIISESLFESILNNINKSKEGLKLKSDNLYHISFGDSKIFIKQKEDNEYLIYELNENQKFVLEYMVKLEKDKTLDDIFKNCDSFKSFLNKQKINIKSEKEQELYFIFRRKKNLTKIGGFTCINPGRKDQDQQGNEDEGDESGDEEEEAEEVPVHCLGLENIGATCYMNATIQCLCHINYLKDYFLNKDLITEATKNKNCPLTLSFYNLINNLWVK